MKKAGSVLWGIVLIAAGVIWTLNEFMKSERGIIEEKEMEYGDRLPESVQDWGHGRSR